MRPFYHLTDYDHYCGWMEQLLILPSRCIGMHSSLGGHRGLTELIYMVKSNSYGEIIKPGGPVTRYLVRVHKWSGQTKYVDINGPTQTIYIVISGPPKT